MDRLQAMQVFARIVELGSFSRAAEQLGLSRASASGLIKQLETHLGTRLLQRTTRQVSPTLDGRSYYQHCQTILAAIDEAESLFSRSARLPRGQLKVDLPAALARLVVIPALPDFYARYPEISLEIGIGDRLIDLVREGVDCVVRIGALGDSSLVARSLPALPRTTCASAAYLAERGTPHDLDGLDGHYGVDFLAAGSGRLQPLEFSVGGHRLARSLPARLAVNNRDAYVAAGEAGLGIVQVPRYHVERQLGTGRLVEVLADYRPPALPLNVLYPHHRHLTPRLRVFIDWLVELFAR